MDSRTFWKKVALFCLFLVLLDFTIGNVLSYFYFTQKKGKLYNVTVALELQSCEALIFGSSRAMHQYDPKIITDSLNFTCYNAGNDAQSILYSNAILDVILERYTPKLIILDLLVEEFMESQQSYDNLYVLNPYVNRHPILWNTLSLKSKSEKIKHCSSIYPYNSMFLRIVSGNLPGKTKDTSDNGFTPREGVWKDTIANERFVPIELDQNKINALLSFCSSCIKNNIDLYIVVSPMYVHIENNSSTILQLNKICSEMNIPVINYVNDKEYIDHSLFLDPTHLNPVGAELFSKNLSHKLLVLKNTKP